ncbi:hypothetical protein Avbf_05137 [Armadillidium vulgare]|nr:hypothetical protein Avbf_05137 [Armadillidium vulgare]
MLEDIIYDNFLIYKEKLAKMTHSLKAWVKDRLHDVLGMSDSSIADYLILLTQKKSNLEDVLDELKSEEFRTFFGGSIRNYATIFSE